MSSTPVSDGRANARAAQSFTSAAADFERSKITEIKRSRKIAWAIAGVSTGLCVLSVASLLVAILFRTEPEPLVLQVDQSTGATTMLRSLRDSKDQFDEVVNKYWLAKYVRTCEGYDWFTISEQFEACKLMSEGSVSAEYSKRVQGASAPLATLKDKGKVIAKVSSIAFFGETAQVRFTSERTSSSGDPLDPSPQKFIATVAFQFKPSVMTEQQRLVNPLGFKAVTYRVDPEVIK